MNKRACCDYTLIEFLVCVALIGILLSLLTPSLNKVISFSQETQCLNQNKHIGTALSLYTEEHAGFMPVAVQGHPEPWVHMKWAYEISPYLSLDFKDLSSFISIGTTFECPSHNFNNFTGIPKKYGGYGQNYSFMGYLEKKAGRFHYNDESLHRQNIHSANHPAESFYSGDSLDFTQNSLSQTTSFTNATHQLTYIYKPTNFGGYFFEYRRHRNGANFLWLDGHASNFFWDDLKLGKNDDTLWYWRLTK